MFIDKSSKFNDSPSFIVYSRWGLQTHIIMNEYGVCYTLNTLTENGKAKVFKTKEEAHAHTDDFFNSVARAKFIAAYEVVNVE